MKFNDIRYKTLRASESRKFWEKTAWNRFYSKIREKPKTLRVKFPLGICT